MKIFVTSNDPEPGKGHRVIPEYGVCACHIYTGFVSLGCPYPTAKLHVVDQKKKKKRVKKIYGK